MYINQVLDSIKLNYIFNKLHWGTIFKIISVEFDFSAVLKLIRYADFKIVFSFLLSRQVLSLQLILIQPLFSW